MVSTFKYSSGCRPYRGPIAHMDSMLFQNDEDHLNFLISNLHTLDSYIKWDNLRSVDQSLQTEPRNKLFIAYRKVSRAKCIRSKACRIQPKQWMMMIWTRIARKLSSTVLSHPCTAITKAATLAAAAVMIMTTIIRLLTTTSKGYPNPYYYRPPWCRSAMTITALSPPPLLPLWLRRQRLLSSLPYDFYFS